MAPLKGRRMTFEQRQIVSVTIQNLHKNLSTTIKVDAVLVLAKLLPCITVVQNRESSRHKFQNHLVLFVIPVVADRDGVRLLRHRRNHIRTTENLNLSLLCNRKILLEVAVKIARSQKTVAIQQDNINLLIRMITGLLLGNEQGQI